MKRAAEQAQRGGIPLYPFLFTLYPILFLYLRNIREVPLTQALCAAAASLAIALALWPATQLVAPGKKKRALILFLFLLLFHSYGLYYDLVAGLLPAGLSPLAAHALAFILPGTVWLILTLLAIRRRGDEAVLSRILGLAVLLLLAWNAIGILAYFGRRQANPPTIDITRSAAQHDSPSSFPDIYCFVLDEFIAPESAFRLYGYDNRRFIASLRGQGFFVAEGSRSRFTLTEPAIADILNLGEYPSGSDASTWVQRNAAAAYLKRKGYRIIEFACNNSLFMKAADERFNYALDNAAIFFNDYYRILFERSLLRILPDLWKLGKTDLSAYYRERIRQVFHELPGIVPQAGPKFVFVHLMAPHEPFVFDADGNPGEPEHLWDHADPEFPRYYLQQYAFISRRMAEISAMILQNSPAPPVILIQSDHGYRGSRRKDSTFPQEEKRQVFNALYLPGISPTTIMPALPPRNNFRLVFNLYFDGKYLLLTNP